MGEVIASCFWSYVLWRDRHLMFLVHIFAAQLLVYVVYLRLLARRLPVWFLMEGIYGLLLHPRTHILSVFKWNICQIISRFLRRHFRL